MLLFASSPLQAATPAGTIIRNHGVIEFETMDGKGYEASSNEVLMIVLPVFGISILPDGDVGSPGQTLRGAASGEMVFPYQMIFTGNAQDSATIAPTFDHANSDFTPMTSSGPAGIYIYNDLDANGQVDAQDVLISTWIDADADEELDASEVSSFGLGRSYMPEEIADILIVFEAPAGALAGQEAFFGVDGASVNDAAKTDTGNISRGLIVDDAVLEITKSANPVGTINAGGTLAYSIAVSNKGSRTANELDYDVDGGTDNYSGVLVYDAIPLDADSGAPLAIIAPAPSGSDTSTNNGTILYSDQSPATGDPATWNWFTAPQPTTTAVGYITSDGATDYGLPLGASIAFSFNITAPGTSQVFSNQAAVSYLDNDLPQADQTVQSNIVTTEVAVATSFGVDIRDTDFEASPPPLTPPDDAANDAQTIANALAGTQVYFTNRVENQGAVDDVFDITLAGVPAAWTAVLLKSDGVTPLEDTVFDGIPDTGVIEPSGTRDIIVRLEIPADQATSAVAVNIIVTATSLGDGTVTDPTTDVVSQTTATSMNLANTDAAEVVNEAIVSQSAYPGGYVDFPLIVENNASATGHTDTYALSAPVIPADWSVQFYADAANFAVLDEDELTPVQDTGPVDPGEHAMVIARVTISDDAPYNGGAPYNITFTATSMDNGASDSIIDRVTINPGDVFELRPDKAGTIEPGSVIVYKHDLVNYGSRPNRYYFTIAKGTGDWSYVFYDENLTALLPEEPAPGPNNGLPYVDLTEAGGLLDSVVISIKIFSGTDAPVGYVDVTTITAHARDFGIAETSSVVEITQVVQGDLTLTKTSNPASGVKVKPGNNVDYTTAFFNKGTGPLSNLIIYDQIPAYTSYVLQSGSSSLPTGITGVTFQISRNGGGTWTNDNAGAGSDSTVTNVRAVMTGVLNPGLKGSVTFRVTVN